MKCCHGKFICVLALVFSMAALLSSCTTKSAAQAKAQEAFLEGQNAALRQTLQTRGVTIVGPVQNPQVPWVTGLTLAQAIATANYLDSHEPKEIIITRDGDSVTLDPKVLLNGTVMPLEAGDVIELRP
jgi:hypothetical protein